MRRLRLLLPAALAAGLLLLGAAPLRALRTVAWDEPHIVATPGFLGQTLCRDTAAVQALTLCNEGGALLTWAIGESGGPLSDVPWLSEDPTGGALDPGACQEIAVTFHAGGLLPGPHMAHLIVASNDPDTPEVWVPTFLSVPEPAHDAGFALVPAQPAAGEEVAFHAWAGGDEPVEYGWNLGDGSAGGGAVVTHTYAAAGDYLVMLTAANACGQATVQHTLLVVPARTWLPLVTR